MTAVSDGEFSPELVLVCPELRQRALESLPDQEWAATIAQVRARTKIVSRPLPRRPRSSRRHVCRAAAAVLHTIFIAATAALTATVAVTPRRSAIAVERPQRG